MEKSRSEILSDIQETLLSLKARIDEIEQRLAALDALDGPAEEPSDAPAPVLEEPLAAEVPSDAAPVFEETVDEAPAVEPEASEPEASEPAASEPVASEPVAEVPAAEPLDDISPIDISIDIDDADFSAPASIPEDTPLPEAPAGEASDEADAPAEGGLVLDGPVQPKTSINDVQERRARKAVMDVMGQKLAWKTAIPGTPVKNVISAISLNDRVLFINTLFKEDPMAFQEAIAAFNAMSSFAEAEEYVRANHPEWNLNSDLVYRLMMAVRRKLR